MTAKPQVKLLVVWPIALMGAPAFVAIWSGWSEVAVRAGLGRVAVVVPVSVVALSVTAGLVAFRRWSRASTETRWLLVCVAVFVASGTALGAALRAVQTGSVPAVIAVLVWLTPLICVAAGTSLYLTARKVV